MRFSLRSIISSCSALAVTALVLAACADVEAPSKPQGDAPASPTPGTENESGDTGQAEAKHTLTVTLDGKGVVRSEPAGIECPGTCSADFPAGTKVTLAATAAEGWSFVEWGNACSGHKGCEVVVDAEQAVSGSLSQIDPRWDPSFGANDCKDAWGAAGEELSPCDKTKDNYVVVRKSARNVAFCKQGALVKNFRSGLGFAPTGDKIKQGDGKTPEGVFFIPRVLPNSEYYKAFLISYPNKDDALRGFNDGLISAGERDQIVSAQTDCHEPAQDTGLGGAVEIHGMGSDEDWTHGCVALDNSSIDTLWSVLGVNDTIVVLP